MDSKSEEISSVFERFRHYLMKNDINPVIDEFNRYRTTWSTNKFRMFLTNALVVMRTWADNPQQVKRTNEPENWDEDEYSPSVTDQIKISANSLFLNIVDYLQSNHAVRMPADMEFDMWIRIITNKWTMNENFYIQLSNSHRPLPYRLTHALHNEMYDFYVTTGTWSSTTKLILIDLDFVHLLIHDNVFLGCNHIISAHNLFTLNDYIELTKHSRRNPEIYQKRLITSMNTPEKMHAFLDSYPDVNLNEFISGNSELYQQRIPLTILDRLLKMDPFYYERIDYRTLSDVTNFISNHLNFQTANILYLFQKLILKDAKFSITLDTAYFHSNRIPFSISTIGIYLLSIIRYRDTFIIAKQNMVSDDDDTLPDLSLTTQNVSPNYLDSLNQNYIYYLIKRASTFTPTFRKFFFHHLNLSCSFLQKNEFIEQRNSTKNVPLRSLYDEVNDQRTLLTLKQRCRLLIKESIRKYPLDIKNLVRLPLTLQYYLSFDLLNPNFVQITINQLNRVEGRIKPSYFDELQFHEHALVTINGHNDWEDQIPDDIDETDDHDNDEQADYDDEDAALFDEERFYFDHDNDDIDEEW